MNDEYKDNLIRRLAENLSSILDFAGESNAYKFVGFGQAWKEANTVCNEAFEYMAPAEEAEHLAELNRGYSQDRI